MTKNCVVKHNEQGAPDKTPPTRVGILVGAMGEVTS